MAVEADGSAGPGPGTAAEAARGGRGERRRGRPRDRAKTRRIIGAATRLFLAHGYDGTSMAAIAAAAGVSKPTLYAQFRDKDGLFQTVVRERCDAYNRPEQLERYLTLPAREALVEMGGNFLALLLSAGSLRLLRVMVAEGTRRPKMAELFFLAGPERLLTLFADYFRKATAKGVLDVDDPKRAAEHFAALVKGTLHFRATLGLRPAPTDAERRAQVESAVELVLRAYAPRPEPAGRRSPQSFGDA